MPRACSICVHPDTAAISKQLSAGGSLRTVADRYQTTHAAVGRHLRNCLRTTRRVEKPAQGEAQVSPSVSSRFDSSDPKTLVETTARLVDEALDLLEHAKRADDRRTALVALREARDGLALLMRVAGLLSNENSSTVLVDQRRQTVQLFAQLTEDELRALAHGGQVPSALTGEIGAPQRDSESVGTA